MGTDSRGYNNGSHAANAHASNVSFHAESRSAYPNGQGGNVQRFGLSGAPAEGNDRGRNFGEKLGTGIGKVLGFVTKPIAYVGDTGVNVLRGIEDSTGMKNIGVGYQANNGYNPRGNNLLFSGSYNSQNGGRSANNNSASSNARQAEQGWNPQTSGFYQVDKATGQYAIFGEQTPYIAGGKKSIYDKSSPEGRAFLEAFKFTNDQYNNNLEAREAHKDSMGTYAGYVTPASHTNRMDLTQAVLEASMRHAAANRDEYSGHLNTHTAGVEYLKEIGSSTTRLRIPAIKDKETMDAIMVALNSATRTNEGVVELSNLLSSGVSEESLKRGLKNFTDPGRREVIKNLSPNDKNVFYNLFNSHFSDPTAEAVKNKLLGAPGVWNDKKLGVITDTDAQSFGIFLTETGGWALRMKDGKNSVDVAIPHNRLEKTFALIGNESIQDKTVKDVKFVDTAEKVMKLVNTFPATMPGHEKFLTETSSTKEAIAKVENAKKEAAKLTIKTEEVKEQIAKVDKSLQAAEKNVFELDDYSSFLADELSDKQYELEQEYPLDSKGTGSLARDAKVLEFDELLAKAEKVNEELATAKEGLEQLKAEKLGALASSVETEESLKAAQEIAATAKAVTEVEEKITKNEQQNVNANPSAFADEVVSIVKNDTGTDYSMFKPVIVEKVNGIIDGSVAPKEFAEIMGVVKTASPKSMDAIKAAAEKFNLPQEAVNNLASNEMPFDQQQAVAANQLPSNGGGHSLS